MLLTVDGLTEALVAAGLLGYVGVFARAAVRRLPPFARASNPFRAVLGIGNRDEVVVVVPFRNPRPPEDQRLQVTYEDMLAANYAERIARLAGVPDGSIELVSAAEFMAAPQDYCDRDVVLICSQKVNPATGTFFEYIRPLGVEFLKGDGETTHGTEEEWEIRVGGTNGDRYVSPSYEEVGRVVPMTGPKKVHDRALIARTTSPWNPERKALVVAGIRGIGTWGAARFLRTYALDLALDSAGRDFHLVVPVTYENLRILPDETAENHVLVPIGGHGSVYWNLRGLFTFRRRRYSSPTR